MKVEKNKVVVLRYEVETEGKVVGSATAEEPFDYIHGTRTILPKLEEVSTSLRDFRRFKYGS